MAVRTCWARRSSATGVAEYQGRQSAGMLRPMEKQVVLTPHIVCTSSLANTPKTGSSGSLPRRLFHVTIWWKKAPPPSTVVKNRQLSSVLSPACRSSVRSRSPTCERVEVSRAGRTLPHNRRSSMLGSAHAHAGTQPHQRTGMMRRVVEQMLASDALHTT